MIKTCTLQPTSKQFLMQWKVWRRGWAELHDELSFRSSDSEWMSFEKSHCNINDSTPIWQSCVLWGLYRAYVVISWACSVMFACNAASTLWNVADIFVFVRINEQSLQCNLSSMFCLAPRGPCTLSNTAKVFGFESWLQIRDYILRRDDNKFPTTVLCRTCTGFHCATTTLKYQMLDYPYHGHHITELLCVRIQGAFGLFRGM